ncbi:MAG: tetratricopeptide repeat protein [Pseudomonadota bacterium]
MHKKDQPSPPNHQSNYVFGEWILNTELHELRNKRSRQTLRLEPKVFQLLQMFIDSNGRVLERETIIAQLWKDTIVGEDALAKTVSRLRQSLRATPKSPDYIETIPKKGYRLLTEVVQQTSHSDEKETTDNAKKFASGWVLTCMAVVALTIAAYLYTPNTDINSDTTAQENELLDRADDFYMRFNRGDNEAALALYQRVLTQDPDNPRAQAGIANTLVQRMIRWPNHPADAASGSSSLGSALESGSLSTPEAKQVLSRALSFAKRAARRAPDNSEVQKALGLTYTANGEIAKARQVYQSILANDDSAWPALINLGEIHQMSGEHELALERFKQAFAAMQQEYANSPQHIGPWQPSVGIHVGNLYEQAGDPNQAEFWYRKVLDLAPFEPQATTQLVRLLLARGDRVEAKTLCDGLSTNVVSVPDCQAAMENQ